MRGIVRLVSRTNGLVAIEDEVGAYTIVDPLSGVLELGDEVEGTLDEVGDGRLHCVGGESFSVVVEDCACDRSRALVLLRQGA